MDNELKLLGKALLSVQKFEFAFYGLATHFPKQNNNDWNGENFLRGDSSQFKMTLGGLKNAYGEKFLLSNSDLDKLLTDRNTLCHNYFRLVHADINNAEKLDDPIKFLEDLIELSNRYTSAISGLMAIILIDKNKIHKLTKIQSKHILIYDEVVRQTVIEKEITKILLRMKDALEQDSILEFLSDRKLNELLELISLHPNEHFGESLQKSFFDTDLMNELNLLKEALENK